MFLTPNRVFCGRFDPKYSTQCEIAKRLQQRTLRAALPPAVTEQVPPAVPAFYPAFT